MESQGTVAAGTQTSAPDARDDLDVITAGPVPGPTTGNTITGAGTVTGASGADTIGSPAAVVTELQGSGGGGPAASDGTLQATGRFGNLEMNAQGDFTYTPNLAVPAPAGAQDVFRYTLANAEGQRDAANLTIQFQGEQPQQLVGQVTGADGVVFLPAGVELSDIRVVGRDLVITLPDGSEMVIPNGAIFVPQLVIGDIEVPPTNVAALLISLEPQPAAGIPMSSGGNFTVDVPPLDPGVPLGDLLPPTEFGYTPPVFEEAGNFVDREPEVLIQPDGQPASANAVDAVDEAALGARGLEPAGTNQESDAETTTGTILIDSPDGPNAVTINGEAVTEVGQQIDGEYGTLTITSISAGAIGYSYTLDDNINHSTQPDEDVFTVTVTDNDGDTDTATLTIDIADDAPIARNDVDSVTEDGPITADGNVFTGIGGSDANATDGVADTPGADDAEMDGFSFGATAGVFGVPLAGAYGSLVMTSSGLYTYTLDNADAAVQALAAGETLTEVFTYTIIDGDGDPATATLTITITGTNDAPTVGTSSVVVSEEGLPGANPDSVGIPSDDTNSATATGTITVGDIDGDELTVTLGEPTGEFYSDGQLIDFSVSADGQTLTGTAGGETIITVTIDDNGNYTVVLSGPVDHPNPDAEDEIALVVPVSVSDGTESAAGSITIAIEDDSPVVTGATAGAGVLLDETDAGSPEGFPISATSATAAIVAASATFGADGPGTITYGLSLQGGVDSISSGLRTAIGDFEITLVQVDADTIEGRYNGSNVAFTIEMNADGTITVTQEVPLEHLVDGPPGPAHDDPLDLGSLVNATITLTDNDGDSASGEAAIGDTIIFEDDGPSIDVTAAADAGVTLTTQDAETIGADEDSASSSADFGSVFDFTFDGGADGAAGVSDLEYSLGVATQGGASGLTQSGATIYLYLVDGVVVGSTSATQAGVSEANTVFDVSTDADGVVTLTQYSQVDHAPETPSDAPFEDQLVSLLDSAVTLTATATVTDNDGDTATDSQTVNIGSNLRFADDGPIAVNDVDSVTGGAIIATGNVLTGTEVDVAEDANASDGNADDIGADVPGRVTQVSFAAEGEDPVVVLVPQGGSATIEGEFGTLTIFANGDYSYERSDSGPVSGEDVFTYTVTDYDGDTDTATLTITVSDNAPVLTAPAPVQLDDDNALGVVGNPGGPGDDAVSGTSGTLTATGGDGDIDFFFSAIQTAPAGFTYNQVDASTLQILQGTTVIATVTLDNETGAYTVVQNNPVDHASLDGMTGDDTENNTPDFNIALVAQDSDGDNSPVQNLLINIDDDTPVLSNVAAGAGVTLDETTAGSPAGFPISATSTTAAITATAAFGADGPAATGSIVYGLDLTGTSDTLATSLQTAQGDFPITLVQIDADTIEGQYNGGLVAFTIEMNDDGTVTLTQEVPLEHLVDGSTAAAHDDPLSLSGLINATITITDGDGDSTTASAPIGANLVIRDDGPSVDVTAAADAGVTLITDDSETIGADEDSASSTADFSGVFDVTFDGGADGTAGVSGGYTLGVASEGGDSGLTQSGATIYLYLVDGVVVGSTATSEATVTAANTVFDVSVGVDGTVTLTQYSQIDHPAADDPDGTDAPFADHTISLADGLITLTASASITDNDGDTATDSQTVNIGSNLVFRDDGPIARSDSDSIVSGGSTATGNVITGTGTDTGVSGADDVGADVPGTIVGVTSEGTGESDSTFNGGVLSVDGDFGTLTIDANGNYTYTRDAGAPGTAVDVFTYTIVDADGDTSEATLTITISDNAPILATPGPVQLDDDNAQGVVGNPGGPGDDAVSGTSGTLVATGGDGDKDFFFAATQTAPAGFTYNLVNASTLQILQGTTVIATVTLNNETGQYTVVQNNPVDHASLDGLAGDNTENNTPNFNIGLFAQDADGDPSPVVNLVINIDDDTPVLSNVAAGAGVTIDETSAGSPAGFPIAGTSATAVITATQAFGADGPAATGSVTYGLDLTGTSNTLATSLQTAQGNFPITLVQIDADTIEGQYNGGLVAFTIQMNANGTVTLTQFVPLEHNVDGSTAAAFDDTLSLAGLINATITITDGDGDSVTGTAPIGANLIIRDDGPDAQVDGTATLDTLILDESRPEGTDTTGGTAPTGDASVTAQFADNFVGTVDYGADGPGTVTYSFALSATAVGSGLFALDGTDTTTTDGDGCGQGAEIILTRSGNTITGAVGGVTYFTIVLDPATGAVTFTQFEPIFHPVEGNFDETVFLNTDLASDVRVIQTVTDSDGDFDTAAINIGQGVFGIQDDGPSTFDPAAITSGLQNQAGETETALLDVDGDIDANVGEDQPGRITFANIVDGQDSGLTAGGQNIEYFLSSDGQTLEARTGGETGTLIFTVTLNQNAEPTDDTYTVTIFQPIDNGAGFVFDDLTSTSAGNVNFRGVGADDPATTVDLLLSASTQAGSSATINTDSDSIGAANQSVDVGETVRIDFVTNLEESPGSPTGFSFDGHVSSNQFLGLIPQVQGSQSETVAFTVYALDTTNTDASEPDRDPDNGFSDSTIVDITSVTVIPTGTTTPITFDVTGLATGVFTPIPNGGGISVRVNADGSVTFSGVQQGDQYGFSTGTDTFNAVAVEAEPTGTGGSTAQSFDLGVFSIGVQDNGDPINLSYDLALTDADCDDLIVEDALQITIQPDTDAAAAATSQMAANDNGNQQIKTAANSNTVLLGAIAAAGLAATPVAASPVPVEQQVVESIALDTGGGAAAAFAPYQAADAVMEARSVGADPKLGEMADTPGSSSWNASETASQASLSGRGPDSGAAQQAQLSQGVEHSPVAAASPVAEGVGMPSAEMIQAALAADGNSAAKSEVGRVVADALQGGAQQDDVEAVIAAVAGGSGAEAALAGLADPGFGSVPAWDSGSLAAFHPSLSAFNMDMMMHQDATPQA